LKQSRKSVKEGRAAAAFIAGDAESRVIQPFEALCAEHGVRVERVETCKELGSACGIEVGAAVAVLLN
jgi:large subunit ribosomal protein L7A